MTHICVGKLTIIGSDNGLSPGRHQAIIWTNAGILLIEHLGTNFSEILIKINTFSFKKMHLKMWSGKWRLFCLCLNVLTLNMLNCFKGYKRCIHISYLILDFIQQKKIKFSMEQPNMLSIQYCQYHVCWCLGNLRSQGISRHDIDQISQNIPSLASEELRQLSVCMCPCIREMCCSGASTPVSYNYKA